MNVPPGSPSIPGEPPSPLPPSARPEVSKGKSCLVVAAIIVGLFIFVNLMSWKIGFVIGLAFIGLGGWLGWRQHAWLKSSQVERGVVVALEENRGKKSTTYRPRLRYTTRAGVDREFVDGVGSSDPDYKVGEKVLVAYDLANPSDERLLAFGERYGWAAFCVALGVGLALLSATIVAGRIAMPRIYAPNLTLTGP